MTLINADPYSRRVSGCAIEVHRTLGPGLAHEAQLLTYLKLSGLRSGLLLNFNEVRLIDGLRRRGRSLRSTTERCHLLCAFVTSW
jgi:hypothetical protein